MKEILNDIAVLSLPHRSWSCEAIKYRLILHPFPGETGDGNHMFLVIEDKFELGKNEKSRSVLASILLNRYPSIPVRRVHFVLYTLKRSPSTPNGIEVNLYNFDRDENRQPIIKVNPVNYSSSSAMCAMIMF
ncbi:hypothetical protein ACI0X9_003317 [Cronobacter turicensis]